MPGDDVTSGPVQPTMADINVFWSIIKYSRNKLDPDWDKVAEACGFKNADVAKTRFGQVRRKLGLQGKPGSGGDPNPRSATTTVGPSTGPPAPTPPPAAAVPTRKRKASAPVPPIAAPPKKKRVRGKKSPWAIPPSFAGGVDADADDDIESNIGADVELKPPKLEFPSGRNLLGYEGGYLPAGGVGPATTTSAAEIPPFASRDLGAGGASPVPALADKNNNAAAAAAAAAKPEPATGHAQAGRGADANLGMDLRAMGY